MLPWRDLLDACNKTGNAVASAVTLREIWSLPCCSCLYKANSRGYVSISCAVGADTFKLSIGAIAKGESYCLVEIASKMKGLIPVGLISWRSPTLSLC